MLNKLKIFIKKYFFVFILILFSANAASFLENNTFKVFFFLMVILSFLVNIRNFKRLEPFILFIIYFWLAINIVTVMTFGNITDSGIFSFLSITSNLLIPYIILKIQKFEFLKNFETVVFWLSFISLPLFTIHYVSPELFWGISSELNFMTIEEQKLSNGWYAGVFMFNGWAEDRNSGFMWEPGAFAFMIILAMFLRLKINQFKFDKHIIIYSIAIVTTFSTMGFIVLLFILLALINKKKRLEVYIFSIPIIIFLLTIYLTELDFIMPKLELYFEEMNNVSRISDIAGGILRMNRFGILKFAVEESVHWPFGYGIFELTPGILRYGEGVHGPNTYAQLIFRWGWIGLFIFIFAVKRMVSYFFINQNSRVKLLMFIAFLLSVSSYNLLNNMFMMSFLYIPFMNFQTSKKQSFIPQLK